MRDMLGFCIMLVVVVFAVYFAKTASKNLAAQGANKGVRGVIMEIWYGTDTGAVK